MFKTFYPGEHPTGYFCGYPKINCTANFIADYYINATCAENYIPFKKREF